MNPSREKRTKQLFIEPRTKTSHRSPLRPMRFQRYTYNCFMLVLQGAARIHFLSLLQEPLVRHQHIGHNHNAWNRNSVDTAHLGSGSESRTHDLSVIDRVLWPVELSR